MITDMFQDVEYERPAETFIRAGHELVNVGITEGTLAKGERGMIVKINRSLKDVTANDFDALFIPGGYSPDKLRINPDAVRLAREFFQADKPVFAICHAAQTSDHSQGSGRASGDRMDVNCPGY